MTAPWPAPGDRSGESAPAPAPPPDRTPRDPPIRRHDGGPLALAAVTWAGAAAAVAVPGPLVALGALAVAVRRRWWVVLVAAALAGSWGGARAWSGLEAPLPPAVEGVAVLRSDPEPAGAGRRSVRVDLAVAGRRYEARAYGPAAARLAPLAAGDEVRIAGTVRPADHDGQPWLVARHVAGLVTVTEAGPARPAAGLLGFANGVRDLLERGRRHGGLRGDVEAVAAGLTTGDDRRQSAEVTAAVRATGLSHLMAVSGQNVAVVLAVVLPLVSRRSPPTRLVALGAVLVVFALVTRWEASVLRATVMAALALGARHLGRPATPMRLLALAVTGLVLVDPLLVHSVGFRLSVAATAGIVVGAPAVEARLRGPAGLRRAVAVTVAAQVAVLPVQVAAFGRPPLVSVAANVAAGPAAGAAMVWGLAAGVVAGVAGAPVAVVAHLPTRLLAAWILAVARVGAGADAGLVGWLGGVPPAALVAASAGVATVVAGRRRARRRRPGDAGRVSADAAPAR